MTDELIFKMAEESDLGFLLGDNWMMQHEIKAFANLITQHEREKLKGQIETLGAMYDLASKQRDALMDEQRAHVAALRGRMQ
jgi:hypothetical protein